MDGTAGMQGWFADSWGSLKQVTLSHLILTNYFTTFLIIYPKGVSAFSRASFGQGTGPVLLSYLGCIGTEEGLLDCPALPGNCGHTEDAGVRCLAQTGIETLKMAILGVVSLW